MFLGLSWPRIGADSGAEGKHQRLLTEGKQKVITYA